MDIPSWARRPDWADALLTRVALEFAQTSVDTPGWPDPHETGDPDRLQYSVCSDPGRYRILDARVDAWARVLERDGIALATRTGPPDTGWLDAPRRPTHLKEVVALAPEVPGALTILFAGTLVDDEPFGLDVAVGRAGLPTLFLEPVPFCGCDACDHGSDEEVARIDDLVLTVARGGVVRARDARDPSRSASAGIDRWSASDRAFEWWLDAGARVPDDVQRWIGEPWLLG